MSYDFFLAGEGVSFLSLLTAPLVWNTKGLIIQLTSILYCIQPPFWITVYYHSNITPSIKCSSGFFNKPILSASTDAHVEKKLETEFYRYLRQYLNTPLPSNGSSPFIHVRNQNQIPVSFKNYGQPHRWNSERARYIYKLIRTHIVAYFKNHWPFHWFQILKGKMKLEYKNFLGDLRSVKIVLYNNKTKKWRLSTI